MFVNGREIDGRCAGDSFIDRSKDTLKIGGAQVSPTEIEDVLRAQPDGLVDDLCVAGVSGGRTSDERVPRAWIVLSDKGRCLGKVKTLEVLEGWAQRSLSRYKWLRGGWEIVDTVSVVSGLTRSATHVYRIFF